MIRIHLDIAADDDAVHCGECGHLGWFNNGTPVFCGLFLERIHEDLECGASKYLRVRVCLEAEEKDR
jgi:hypothetical protein